MWWAISTCALLIVAVKDGAPYQAQLTFAMARHAAVDLALVFRVPAGTPNDDRLPGELLGRLRQQLAGAGLQMCDGEEFEKRVTALRGMYEPFVSALAEYFLFALPPVVPEKPPVDNWQTSAWMRRTPGIGRLPGIAPDDEHFD